MTETTHLADCPACRRHADGGGIRGRHAWYDAEAAGDLDEIYRLVIDGEELSLTSIRGGSRRAQERDPNLVLTPLPTSSSQPVAAKPQWRTRSRAAPSRLKAARAEAFQDVFRLS